MICLYCHQRITNEPTVISLFVKSEPLCQSCRDSLEEKFFGPRCGRCHQVVQVEIDICEDCQLLINRYPHVNQITVITDYNDAVKMLLHRYKFLKDQAMAMIMKYLSDFNFKNYDLVVPIPISSARLKERTYNQVTEMLNVMKVDYQLILETSKKKRQSDLSRAARLNKENPFFLSENVKDCDFSGMSVLIVDDIYTTGVTVHQAADIISNLNFQKIDVLTFSKAQHIWYNEIKKKGNI